MAKRYLNKEERDFYAVIRAFSFFLGDKVDALSESHKHIKEIRQKLRSAKTFTEKAASQLLEPLDPSDQDRAAAEGGKMRVVTRYSDKAMQDYKEILTLDSYTPMKTDHFLSLVSHSLIGTCQVCTKKGEEADGCEMKQIFIAYDVEPYNLSAPAGKCPYQYEGV
ncbi:MULTISPECIES: DUF5651 domain-containing protein [Pelosinus]|uniref:DUF5651 domain-containing protein n=1 Tax=Pelosinus fermentans B4 TaxID=1149862 RepID=I9B488_9FIRM|nr:MULTISPECIES: DUF5651 domain-containing protein [Pelosinus]EIW19942.1 hypothetical protein FB4_0193 [Pelosinus fermentans B4]EIW21201.1 hypothetical protein FA11_0928 [Pelosinus fermentans A11]